MKSFGFNFDPVRKDSAITGNFIIVKIFCMLTAPLSPNQILISVAILDIIGDTKKRKTNQPLNHIIEILVRPKPSNGTVHIAHSVIPSAVATPLP